MAGQQLPPVQVPGTIPPPAGDDHDNLSTTVGGVAANVGGQQGAIAGADAALPPGYLEMDPRYQGTIHQKANTYIQTAGEQVETAGRGLIDYLGSIWKDTPTPTEADPSNPTFNDVTTRPNKDTLPLKEAYNATDQYPNPIERRQDIASQRLAVDPALAGTPGPNGGILTPIEEFREEYKPNPLGDVNTVLQPLMVPIYAGGSLLAAGAFALPEKGVSPSGGFLDSYSSHFYANSIKAAQKVGAAAGPAMPLIVAKSLYDAYANPADDTDYGQIGHNYYQAMSSGDLWRQTQADRSSEIPNAMAGAGAGFVLGAPLGPPAQGAFAAIGSKLAPDGSFTYPMLRGVHVLDKAIPPDLANKLLLSVADDDSLGGQAEALMWSALGTHAGRELVGAAMEVAGDPMNGFGPAAGSQRLLHRGVEFEVSAPALRGAAAYESATGAPFIMAKGVMADLVHGDEAIKAGAKAQVSDAFSELSRRYVDAQGRLNVELAKDIPDPFKVTKLRNEADIASRSYSDLERSVSLLRAGSPNGYMQPVGRFAVHIPGSDATYFASQLASPITDSQYGQRLIRKMGDTYQGTRGEIFDRSLGKLDWEHLDARVAANKLNKPSPLPETAGMTGGERMAWYVKKYGGTGVEDGLYRLTYDALNQVLGSRFVEPLTHRAAALHHAVASASEEATIRFARSTPYQRIARGLNSEPYQKAQDAVTRVFAKLQSRYDTLNRYIKNIAKYSNVAHGYQLRQKAYEMAKVEDRLQAVNARLAERIPYNEERTLRAEKYSLLNRQAEVEYWGTEAHTSADIMDRAFDYVARGAGWGAPAELRPAVDEWQKFYDEVQSAVDDVDRVAVSNMLAGVARRGVGDPTMENHLRAGMAQVKELMLNGDFERLQALANARLFQVGGLNALMDDLSPQGLAAVLERVLKLGGPVERNRQAIAEVLDGIIPDTGMVEDLLARATVITGDRNPYDAVMTLANMMRGDGGKMSDEITALVKKWQEDELTLRRLSVGEYTPELRDAASQSALAASVQRRVAQVRGRIGEDSWEDFLNWAADERRADSAVWNEYLPTWKRIESMAMAAADARGGVQAALSKLRAQLTDNMVGAERVNAALEEAAAMGKAVAKPSAAKDALLKALDSVLHVEYPVIRAIADDIADSVLKDAMVLEKPEDLIVGASTRNDVKSFEDEIKKVEPRFQYPPDSKYNPPTTPAERTQGVALKMDDLERKSYETWLDIKRRHNLNDEQALYVAMSALVHSPDIPNALEWAETAKRYDGVFGTRFMPVPDDMVEPVKMARALIASYEDLFKRDGIDILKSPYRLMKEEGVVEYAPKIPVQRSDVASGPQIIRDLNRSSAWMGKTVDTALNTELNAAKRRQSVGTARELNAWADDASNTVYSYRPAFLLGKYLQTNKAITAQEFLDELSTLGVIRSFQGNSQVSRHVAATAEGYTPLFREGDEKFAGFVSDAKEVREAYKLEGILGSMSESDRLMVEHLAEQKQYEPAAAMLQEAAGKEVTIGQVERYFGEDSVRRMYVPDSVHQSLHDIFEMNTDGGWAHNKLENSARFIKPWLTMIHVAYHATNAAGNTFQRIVDLGAMGAMNPKTLLLASRLHAAGVVADRWGAGSLTDALDTLAGKGKAVTRTGLLGLKDEVGAAVTEAEKAVWRAYADGYGLERAAKEGLDLGDGALRDADEALRILRENKIIDLHFGHQIDVGAAEALAGEKQYLSEYGPLWGAAKLGADAAIVGLPLVAGAHAPVTLGFKYGEMVGKTIENQAKLTNFVGSMRRVPSIQDASASVIRRYFNYLDLTGAQRMHLRTFFPFITWPLKNLHVQFEQMARNPAFYAWYSRFMLETAPRISQAIEADHENTSFVPVNPYDERAGMDDWGYAEFRINLPEALGGSRDAVVTGFKDPVASMVGTMGEVTGLFNNPLSRAHLYGGRTHLMNTVSQLHWYLSILPDLYFNDKAYDSLAGKPIGDETAAYDLRTVLESVYSMPHVGPVVAAYMANYAGFYQLWERDTATGELRPVPFAHPGVNYVIKKSQLSRLFKAATRSAEDQLRFTAATLLNEEVTDSDGVPYDPRVDPIWNSLSVTLGPRIEIESPYGRLDRMDKAIDAASKHESNAAGSTSTHETTGIRK